MDHTTLIHHHVSVSIPTLTSTQLAYFSLLESPTELRLHFWTQTSGFPTTAIRFCTHFNTERTVSYEGTASTKLHSPEHVATGPPSQIACGGGPSPRFILELNRLVWGELHSPVPSLTALRFSVAAKIESMLEQGGRTVGEGEDKMVSDEAPGA